MTKEFYTPVETKRIPSFVHTRVQDFTAIQKSAGFNPEDIDIFSVVVVPQNEADVDREISLRRISEYHGRSFEVDMGDCSAILWQDEYGNFFSSVVLKGNDLTEASVVFKNSSAPSGYAVSGLQTGESLVRILKASDLLRRVGIETEAILGVIEPEKIPDIGEDLSQAELKQRLLQRIWQEELKGASDRIPSKDEMPEIAKFLTNTSFFITVRGQQAPERIADLDILDDDIRVGDVLKRAFVFVNAREREKAQSNPGYKAEYFNYTDENDIKGYLHEYLPKKIAHNLATLHKLGLVHGFLHHGNIATTGGFYDLDSMRGKPLGLGDASITEEEIFNDIEMVNDIMSDKEFKKNFLMTYIERVGWLGDVVSEFENVSALLYNSLNPDEAKAVLLDLIKNQTGLTGGNGDFTLSLKSEDINSLLETPNEGDEFLRLVAGDLVITNPELFGRFRKTVEYDLMVINKDRLQSLFLKKGEEYIQRALRAMSLIIIREHVEKLENFFKGLKDKNDENL